MIFFFIFLLYKYYFNGKLIDSNVSIKYFIKNSFGLGKKMFFAIESRIENYKELL